MDIEESLSPSSLDGKAALILWGNVDHNAVDEAEFNEWWTHEHLTERLRLPGFVRARRYFSPKREEDDLTEYITLYEAESLGHINPLKPEGEAYGQALNNPTPKTQQFMPSFNHMERLAFSVVDSFSPSSIHGLRSHVGNWIAVMSFSSLKLSETALDKMVGAVTDRRSGGLLATHFLALDLETTRAGTANKSYKGVSLEEDREGMGLELDVCILEFALASPEPTIAQVTRALVEALIDTGAENMKWKTYQLICAVSSAAVASRETSRMADVPSRYGALYVEQKGTGPSSLLSDDNA